MKHWKKFGKRGFALFLTLLMLLSVLPISAMAANVTGEAFTVKVVKVVNGNAVDTKTMDRVCLQTTSHSGYVHSENVYKLGQAAFGSSCYYGNYKGYNWSQYTTVPTTYTAGKPTNNNYWSVHFNHTGSGYKANETLFLFYEDPTYTVTVKYVFEDGSKAADSNSVTDINGTEYYWTSPTISGYTPDKPTVSGTINGNKTITVTYKEDAKTYYGRLLYNKNTSVNVSNMPGEMSVSGTAQSYTRNVSSNIPTRTDGYVFKGWNTDQAAANAGTVLYAAGASIAIPATSTNSNSPTTTRLYAVWEVAKPAIDVTKTVNGSATRAPGDNVTFVIKVQNSGNVDFSMALVTDTLPDGLTYVSATGNPISTGSTVIWVVNSLAAGKAHTFTVTAKVDEDADGTLTNTVLAKGQTADNVQSDDTGSASVTVTSAPKIIYKPGEGGTGTGKTDTWDNTWDSYTVKGLYGAGITAKDGYDFLYWQGSDGKTYGPGDEVSPKPSSDLTLTAIWKQNDPGTRDGNFTVKKSFVGLADGVNGPKVNLTYAAYRTKDGIEVSGSRTTGSVTLTKQSDGTYQGNIAMPVWEYQTDSPNGSIRYLTEAEGVRYKNVVEISEDLTTAAVTNYTHKGFSAVYVADGSNVDGDTVKFVISGASTAKTLAVKNTYEPKPFNANPDGWSLDIVKMISNYGNSGGEINPNNLPNGFAIDVTVSYFDGEKRVEETKTLTKADAPRVNPVACPTAGKQNWEMAWDGVFKLPNWRFDFAGTEKTAADFTEYNTVITIAEKNWKIDGYTCTPSRYRSESSSDPFNATTGTLTITIPVEQSRDNDLRNQSSYGLGNKYVANRATYKVEWYDADGNVIKTDSTFRFDYAGNTVVPTDADKQDIEKDGATYTFNADDARNVLEYTLKGGANGVVLKLYFTKNQVENPKLTGITKKLEFTDPADLTNVKVDDTVTLTYKITVTGEKGANYVVTDPDAEPATITGTLDDTGKAELTVTKTVTAAAAGTLSVSNTAYVKPGDGTDPVDPKDPDDGHPSNPVDTNIPVTDPAPVSIEKSADKSEAKPGETVKYTVTIKNLTSQQQTVTFKDVLPAGLKLGQYMEVGGTGIGSYTGSGLEWEIILYAGGVATIQYSATVDADATGTLTNTATVTVDGKDYSDDANVTVKTPEPPEMVKLNVRKEFVGIDEVPAGFQLTYKAGDTTGTLTADGQTGTTLTWTIDVPKGETITFTESGAKVDGKTLTVSNLTYTPTSNSVQTPAAIALLYDVTGEDSDSATTGIPSAQIPTFTITNTYKDETVDPGPTGDPLHLTKKVNNKDSVEAKQNDTVTYTVSVKNDTGVALKDFLIVDKMPEGVTLNGGGTVKVDNGEPQSVTPTEGDEGYNWAVDDTIPAGATVVLTYEATVTVDTESELVNTAIAYANEADAVQEISLIDLEATAMDFSTAQPEPDVTEELPTVEETPAVEETPTAEEPSAPEQLPAAGDDLEVSQIGAVNDLLVSPESQINTFSLLIDKLSSVVSNEDSTAVTVRYDFTSNSDQATVTPGQGGDETQDNGNGISVEKTLTSINGQADVTKAKAGDVIVWTITVTNNSNVEKTVTLTEKLNGAKLFSDSDCTTELSESKVTLAANASTFVYAKYTVQESDAAGKLTNVVTGETGKPGEDKEGKDETVEIENPENPPIITDDGNGISITKTRTSAATAKKGDKITWDIVVKNESNVQKTVTLTELEGVTLSKTQVTLAAGRSETVTAEYTVTGDETVDADGKFFNTVKASTGDNGDNENPEATDNGTEIEKPENPPVNPNQVTITIQFVDPNGNVVKTETVTVDKDSEYDVADKTIEIPDGYVANGNPTGDPISGTANGNKVITVPVRVPDGGNGGGGTRPRPNPTPNPGTEIEDPDVPLAELPDENVEIPDTDVPLAELPDEDVPLAEVPHTGDMTAIWYTTAILAAGCWFYLQRKKTGETS